MKKIRKSNEITSQPFHLCDEQIHVMFYSNKKDINTIFDAQPGNVM